MDIGWDDSIETYTGTSLGDYSLPLLTCTTNISGRFEMVGVLARKANGSLIVPTLLLCFDDRLSLLLFIARNYGRMASFSRGQ